MKLLNTRVQCKISVRNEGMVDRNYRRYVQSKVKVYTDTKENVKSYNKFQK